VEAREDNFSSGREMTLHEAGGSQPPVPPEERENKKLKGKRKKGTQGEKKNK